VTDFSGFLADLIKRYPDLEACSSDVQAAFELLRDCFSGGGKVLVCGSGGSAADSEHIVGELMKGFRLERPVPDSLRHTLNLTFPDEAAYLAAHLQRALPALSLVSQTALMTAFANDVAPDMVFAQQVYGYGKPGDVLWGISTSGNSRNVLNALYVAKGLGLQTLGLSGQTGGKMKALCNVTIRAPATETLEIQERHLPIYHTLCLMLEDHFFSTVI
jgi:D-sedoheptulose 7-phosphate isomerase